MHCFVFICGRQASGRWWIDCAIPRLRINFGIYVFVCRKCGISVRSRVCAGQIIPAFSAVKRMRKLHYLVGLLTCCGCRRASWHQLVRRRSLGTLDVQLYTACFVRCSLDSRAHPTFLPFSAARDHVHCALCKRSMWPPFTAEISAMAVAVVFCRNHFSPPGRESCFPPQEVARCEGTMGPLLPNCSASGRRPPELAQGVRAQLCQRIPSFFFVPRWFFAGWYSFMRL